MISCRGIDRWTYDWDIKLTLSNTAEVADHVADDGSNVQVLGDTVTREHWNIDLTLGNTSEVADDVVDDRSNVQVACDPVTREDWDTNVTLVGNTTKVANDIADNGSNVQVIGDGVVGTLGRLACYPNDICLLTIGAYIVG